MSGQCLVYQSIIMNRDLLLFISITTNNSLHHKIIVNKYLYLPTIKSLIFHLLLINNSSINLKQHKSHVLQRKKVSLLKVELEEIQVVRQQTRKQLWHVLRKQLKIKVFIFRMREIQLEEGHNLRINLLIMKDTKTFWDILKILKKIIHNITSLQSSSTEIHLDFPLIVDSWDKVYLHIVIQAVTHQEEWVITQEVSRQAARKQVQNPRW